VLRQINARDLQDSTRTHSPLKMAADAVEVNTNDLNKGQVVSAVITLLNEKLEGDNP